jgi:hypothetical protein
MSETATTTPSAPAAEDPLKIAGPAPASPPEVLELKPNKAADATSGPHPQISPTAYVTWTKPDGSTFLAPLSNSETYERKGYTKGAEQQIEDLVAYYAEQAKKPAAEPAAESTPA